MNDSAKQVSTAATNLVSDEETESIEESATERSQQDVDFSARSKASKFRGLKMLDRGMAPFHNGRPTYLTVEEEHTLVQQLINWSNMETIPAVSQLPELVFNFNFIQHLQISFPGDEDSRKKEMRKISSPFHKDEKMATISQNYSFISSIYPLGL
jgi:hypothetical protein